MSRLPKLTNEAQRQILYKIRSVLNTWFHSPDIHSGSHSELISSEIDLLEIEGLITEPERDWIVSILNDLHTLLLTK